MNHLDFQARMAALQVVVTANLAGRAHEKAGRTDDAIALYEQNVARKADTPFPYRRLAIIYSKRKQFADAIRVLEVAVAAIPTENANHHDSLAARLVKLRAKHSQ